MRARSSPQLPIRLTASAALTLATCGGTRSAAPAGTMAPRSVEVAWRVETVLEQPGQRLFSTPSVFFVDGLPAAVTANRAPYLGVQSVIALRRTTDAGWRVEFAKSRSAWRVCGEAQDDGAMLISYGDLQGELEGLRWTGSAASEAAPGRCERDTRVSDGMQCKLDTTELGDRELRCWRTSTSAAESAPLCPPIVAQAGMRIETYAAALDEQGRMRVAYFERVPNNEGSVRHAICEQGAWTASTVARTLTADLGMAIGPRGHSHLVFDDQFDDHAKLHYASTAPADAVPEIDGRIAPALEACRRSRLDAPGHMDEGLGTFQRGDGFRCAVLAEDVEVLEAARAQLDDACEQGDGSSCVLAGMTRDWLLARYNRAVRIPTATTSSFAGQRSGISVPEEAKDQLGAGAYYRRGCRLDDAQGCALAADLDPQGATGVPPAGALAACKAGWPEACAVVLSSHGLGPDSAAVTATVPILAASCRDGDAFSCNNLGVIRWLEGDAEQAREHFTVACEASIEVGCENLATAGETAAAAARAR